ncbi:MAG: PqqD family protein [Ignavibacteriales bacterium]|nr:MAG: PqqD family protein [Ignavibacteriaceae bacterium]MBW7874190.1 PqqD family protein [Ignavibacteria bacterium]MCZ2142965.1 PqqD family protein [Ignavibacteriales bacterium]OQY79200.1 MAG: hypothetical protein B6D45_01280 [Ignavibacteriales bacterium UTCHB3]MBV6444483.1 hypothetical protein [Ignavibacteriaceae bacterium]
MKIFEVPGYAAISETGFIFLGNTGETFNLNEIGKEIYELIKKKKPYDEIVSEIMNNYDSDQLTVERDLDDFINQLKSFGLVTEK